MLRIDHSEFHLLQCSCLKYKAPTMGRQAHDGGFDPVRDFRK